MDNLLIINKSHKFPKNIYVIILIKIYNKNIIIGETKIKHIKFPNILYIIIINTL
jgi:hypothetical protein